MVGEDLVLAAVGAGRLDHDLERLTAVGPVRVAVAVTAQVGSFHQARQGADSGSLDLAATLAQLGRDRLEVQEGVEVGLAREGQWLGRLVIERHQTSLRQRPAALAGTVAQGHVVVGRTGEVDEVAAGLSGRHGHDVELRAICQSHARAVRATADPGLRAFDHGQVANRPQHRLAVPGLDQQVEVADRLAPASDRTRRGRRNHARQLLHLRQHSLSERVGLADRHASRWSLSEARRCPR